MNFFFLPHILKRMSFSDIQIGWIAIAPWLVGLNVIARHSDATGERVWHFSAPIISVGIFLIISGLTIGAPLISIIFLTLSCAGLLPALGNFWAKPTAMMTAVAATVGIAIINSVGNLGGFFGPYIMGILQDASGGSNVTGLFFMGGLSIIGGLLFAFAVKEN